MKEVETETETETRRLTIIPFNRTTNKDSGPNAHRDKQATDSRSDNTHNHNGMLLGRWVCIDNHPERLWYRLERGTSVKNGTIFQSRPMVIYDQAPFGGFSGQRKARKERIRAEVVSLRLDNSIDPSMHTAVLCAYGALQPCFLQPMGSLPCTSSLASTMFSMHHKCTCC